MSTNVASAEALRRLIDGNKRHIAGNYVRPHQSPARRIEVADAQNPFALILGCSDSRVPPEIIFDQGLGDLFVVRTVGHVLDEMVLASILYAVEQLGIQLVVVLGHKDCGAVKAAVEGLPHPHLAQVVRAIQPAVKKVKFQPSALVDNAVRMHTALTVQELHITGSMSKHVQAGKLSIVGAYYDLGNGSVTLAESG